jgi:hypothetical protein
MGELALPEFEVPVFVAQEVALAQVHAVLLC